MTPNRRFVLLALAALALPACSEIDCTEPQRYAGAKLEKPLAVPDGLSPLEPTDAHVIPGGAPAEHGGGACLVKPPRLVEEPAEVDD